MLTPNLPLIRLSNNIHGGDIHNQIYTHKRASQLEDKIGLGANAVKIYVWIWFQFFLLLMGTFFFLCFIKPVLLAFFCLVFVFLLFLSCVPFWTVNWQLSTLNCQLSSVKCQLSSVNYQLSIVKCQLSTVNCQLHNINHQQSTIRSPNWNIFLTLFWTTDAHKDPMSCWG